MTCQSSLLRQFWHQLCCQTCPWSLCSKVSCLLIVRLCVQSTSNIQKMQGLIEDSETAQRYCALMLYRYYNWKTKMELLAMQTKLPSLFIDTIIKSINHATNLSLQLANITSTGTLSSPPILAAGGGPLFAESTYLTNKTFPSIVYDFIP